MVKSFMKLQSVRPDSHPTNRYEHFATARKMIATKSRDLLSATLDEYRVRGVEAVVSISIPQDNLQIAIVVAMRQTVAARRTTCRSNPLKAIISARSEFRLCKDRPSRRDRQG